MNRTGSTGLEASNHRQWVKDLRNRPRDDAARLVAGRYPHLSGEEVQRRLSFLDAPPTRPAKLVPVQLPKEVADARKAARKAAVKSGRPARQQHELERKLAAATRKARHDETRR